MKEIIIADKKQNINSNSLYVLQIMLETSENYLESLTQNEDLTKEEKEKIEIAKSNILKIGESLEELYEKENLFLEFLETKLIETKQKIEKQKKKLNEVKIEMQKNSKIIKNYSVEKKLKYGVKIVEKDLLNSQYLKTTTAPDKPLITKSLVSGIKVDGAELVEIEEIKVKQKRLNRKNFGG